MLILFTIIFILSSYSEIRPKNGVIEIGKKYSIISGVVDVDYYNNSMGTPQGKYKKITKFDSDYYYQLIGSYPDEMIIETMVESDCEVDRVGEYEFHAILTMVEGEYNEYGRATMNDYLEICHIRWDFIQSFEQRNRQIKLDQVLDNLDIFKL